MRERGPWGDPPQAARLWSGVQPQSLTAAMTMPASVPATMMPCIQSQSGFMPRRVPAGRRRRCQLARPVGGGCEGPEG